VLLLLATTARAEELRGAILGAGYGGPLGAHASVAYFSGKEGYSELVPVPVLSVTPELSLGTGGGKLSLGLTAEAIFASLTLKGSALRSAWNPVGIPRDSTYVGPELDVGFRFVRLSAGALFRAGGQGDNVVFTWGVGLRLPLLTEHDEAGEAYDRERREAKRRADALARRKDGQAQLAATVLTGPGDRVTIEALDRLTDPERLWEVAVKQEWTRHVALPRLCSTPAALDAIVDPERLLLLARDHPYEWYRLEAGRRYRERVAAPTDDPAALLDYDVEHTEDQKLLCDVALEHPSYDMRRRATSRLTDPQRLAWLTGHGDAAVQAEAARRVAFLEAQARVAALTDDAEIARLATSDPSATVRSLALDRVSDPMVLVHVALNESETSLRREAVGRLSDQRLLAQIAAEDSDAGVRRQAIGKVTDRRLLLDVASSKGSDVEAVERLWPSGTGRRGTDLGAGAAGRGRATASGAESRRRGGRAYSGRGDARRHRAHRVPGRGAAGGHRQAHRSPAPRRRAEGLGARQGSRGCAPSGWAAPLSACARPRAVAAVEDPALLVEIALHDPREPVARAALAQNDAPGGLVAIAVGTRAARSGAAAVDRMHERAPSRRCTRPARSRRTAHAQGHRAAVGEAHPAVPTTPRLPSAASPRSERPGRRARCSPRSRGRAAPLRRPRWTLSPGGPKRRPQTPPPNGTARSRTEAC
jgi:hypothetical protein